MTFTFSLSLPIAASAAMTDAAPVMSAFMWCMFSAGLREIPPESKVIPFPTSARSYPDPPRPLCRMTTSRGGSWLPCATER